VLLVERSTEREVIAKCIFSLYFAGDFSKTAEAISTELSTQTADGLE